MRQARIVAIIAYCATLALAGAETATADPQTVSFHSLKLIQKSGRLLVSAKDPSIPFPGDASYTNPDVGGMTLTIYTNVEPGGRSFQAGYNQAGENPRWVLKTTGSGRKWTYRAPATVTTGIKRLSIADDGKLKAIVGGAFGLVPDAPSAVFVDLRESAFQVWQICARFEAADTASLTPGVTLKLGDSTGAAHVSNCAPPIYEGCGDGELDAGEACDDYNAFSGDGCSATCATEVCGDGLLNPQEDCDDGNTAGGDDCPADCAICGSNKVAGGEDCDPPYSIGGERLCSDDCSFAPCGDGVVEAGENCEPTSGLDTACPGACGTGGTLACSCPGACGNGVVDGAESCDPHAPRSSWTCPEPGLYEVQCGLPNRGVPCGCCDGACGLGAIGCCEAASCVIFHMGIGACSSVQACIVDEGCSEGLSCDMSTNTCCIDAGGTCSFNGTPTGLCCPGTTCSGGSLGVCF